MKSVLWRVVKCLSYIEDAGFLKVNVVLCGMNEGDRSGTVVKVLCYKSEGRRFGSRWCHWNFSLT